MASEIAHEFARKHLETDVTVGASRLMTNLDESLQKVRKCLDEAIARLEQLNQGTEELGPDPTLERLRALYQRLQVKE